MKSLRLRLVVTLCISICVLWSTVAAWMFTSMRSELQNVLDDRLVASTRMVAGIVGQFSHAHVEPAGEPGPQVDLTSVIARDGVACEVSLVRSEVEVLPIASTDNSPGFGQLAELGFGRITKGGKPWRTYVLEENGIRITTADRIDIRESLMQSFAYAMVLPFVMALIGVLAITWWVGTKGLEPLRRLQQALAQRPPQDNTPIEVGQDIAELAPMVKSLNALLERTHAALEHERRWTADAAHELRTPLTAIKTHMQVTQLLCERESARLGEHSFAASEQIKQALEHTQQGISHMQDTLEQLLLLARIEGTSAPVVEQQTGAQILAAVERACEQSTKNARAKGDEAALITIIHPSDPSGWQDRVIVLPLPVSLLISAISNVLDNALRHNSGMQPVEIEWRVDPGLQALCILVRDYGPGMTDAECAQAMQRFWRKNPLGQGAGLGLTIVQRILYSAGGQLSLEAATGGGLRVALHVPLHVPLGT
ncbi:MAG TPA: ATP-binding protein [Comamonas sp.]